MSDSDAGEKKADGPSWQQDPAQKPLQEDDKPAEEPKPNRETILASARKFLQEEEVKDASTDKKIAFLESKGLGSEDIQELLSVSKDSEASSSTTPQVEATTEKPDEISDAIPDEIPDSSPPPPANYPAEFPPQPPIITYPEFLIAPSQPTPIITKPRLLTTLYLFSSLSLLLYGTSEFLVAPMVANLTASRISLASTASANLSKMIQKLEGMVSEIPEECSNDKTEQGNTAAEDSEAEDPSELFHRDIGVQTSPPQSRAASPSPLSPLKSQSTRLASLTKSMQGLISDGNSEGEGAKELETTIGILREYLDGIAYVPPVYGYNNGFGMGVTPKEDDEIARVKAGIRGVKGVLLSARSFPGGVRAGSK
ncbi:hypothetical protein HYALB_00007208 [Hymenoscyphus albidus]|uniref:Peroxisomal membrane protein PEX14 n=1 Tax=Hymenoscyphus albidus TaxID=595503 RepID=A0A9N9PQV1_9HELO|nr:hypothetical protein HYALB_00007208 [Hymenoscyphus albidus]